MSQYIKNKQLEIISDFDINNYRLLNVDTPINSLDAVNKDFVDINAINYALGTGLYSGGTISISSSSTFNVYAGIGYFVDSISKEITRVTWNDQLNISIISFGSTDITVSIAIDSDGNIFQQIPKFTCAQRNDYILLGEIFIHPTQRILADVIFYPVLSRDLASIIDFSFVDGPKVCDGNNVNPNGANLLLDVTNGCISGYSVNASNSLIIPNKSSQIAITGISYFENWYNGTEWIFTGSTNTINPDLWSNGSATLQTASNNDFNLRILYRSATNGDAFLLSYPTQTEEYGSMSEAESAINQMGVEYPPELFGITVPLCWIIIQEGSTELNDPDTARLIPIQSVSTAAGSVATDAIDVSYNASTSTNLSATTVQEALEIINNRVESLNYSFNNEDMVALSGTSGIYLATNTTITDVPFTRVRVTINGLKVTVGDGVKTTDCFFSDDSGSTAKTYSNVAQLDELYWNGDVADYQLGIQDAIDFIYMTR